MYIIMLLVQIDIPAKEKCPCKSPKIHCSELCSCSTTRMLCKTWWVESKHFKLALLWAFRVSGNFTSCINAMTKKDYAPCTYVAMYACAYIIIEPLSQTISSISYPFGEGNMLKIHNILTLCFFLIHACKVLESYVTYNASFVTCCMLMYNSHWACSSLFIDTLVFM